MGGLLVRGDGVRVENTVAPWALVGLVIVLTRLPFIGHGYGEDPDAWRAMIAARHLLDTGLYVPSRSPGYPLPEYVDTAMLALGLGASVWIGLLSAVLSGVASALVAKLFSPLGTTRAAAGALAFGFTPEFFTDSTTAMDFVWGITFFLASTLAMLNRRVWWAAVALGLAIASRPTYVFAAIPLALIYVDFDVRQIVHWKTLRYLAFPALTAFLIGALFFAPAVYTTGRNLLSIYAPGISVIQIVFYGTVGLFGVIGSIAVAAASLSAWLNRHNVAVGDLDRWAITVAVLWGLLFVLLPQDSGYLIPALVGLYWLIAKFSDRAMLWIMVAALLSSCFFLRFDTGTRSIRAAGPVLSDIQTQRERSCIAEAVRQRLEVSDDYVIASYLNSQLIWEIGPPWSERILYDGSETDDDGGKLPPGADLLVIDRVTEKQQPLTGVDIPVLVVPC